MNRRRLIAALLTLAALVLLLLVAVPAMGYVSGDTLVNTGSGPSPFPVNKQNEPVIAVNPMDPSVMVAGANEEIDNAPAVGNNTSFTPGVGDSGVYFSFNSGETWMQPTYTGWSARTGTPQVGPIGTLPWYYERRLVSDGDPLVTFGPQPKNGTFSWSNGVRLYYSNLTSNFATVRSEQAFRGYEAIAVSRFDDPTASRVTVQGNWKPPVIVSSRTSSVTFSDKESLWADNAATSKYFGNVYVAWVSFRSNGGGGAPEPVLFSRSRNGGATWSAPKAVTAAADSNANPGRQGVQVRTDSHGVVYLFWEGYDAKTKSSVQYMERSFDGGASFSRPRIVAMVTDVGVLQPSGYAYFDGVQGARTDSYPIVDVANGAPSGENATNLIAMSWADARQGLNHEEALVQVSKDRGLTWSMPVNAAESTDRPDFPSIAISPNGKDVYLTYDGFLDPFRVNLTDSRLFQGVVRHADVTDGTIGDWTTFHRGVSGDARASSANALSDEFLGDYNWIVATDDFAAAVWNDARNASLDQGVLDYRASLLTSIPLPKPAPTVATFGNTDIYGTVILDPTP
jgi:hypothetical protein